MTRRPRSILVAVAVLVLITGCATATTSTRPPTPPDASPTPAATSGSARLPVVIDLDLDSSDISALAVLLRDPRLAIRAILLDGTGLVHCGPGLRNTSYLLGQFGVTGIPIACGREDAGADGRPFPADWRVGPDTAWGIDIPPQLTTGMPEEASALLARVLSGERRTR